MRVCAVTAPRQYLSLFDANLHQSQPEIDPKMLQNRPRRLPNPPPEVPKSTPEVPVGPKVHQKWTIDAKLKIRTIFCVKKACWGAAGDPKRLPQSHPKPGIFRESRFFSIFCVSLMQKWKNLCIFTISHLEINKHDLKKTSKNTRPNHIYQARVEKAANSWFSWIGVLCSKYLVFK